MSKGVNVVCHILNLCHICNSYNSTIIYYKITSTEQIEIFASRTKMPSNIFSFCAGIFFFTVSAQLFWSVVWSHSITSHHDRPQLSRPDINTALRKTDTVNLPHRSPNQENELTCNLIFQPIKLSSESLSQHEKPPKVCISDKMRLVRKRFVIVKTPDFPIRKEALLTDNMFFSQQSIRGWKSPSFSWVLLNLKICVD